MILTRWFCAFLSLLAALSPAVAQVKDIPLGTWRTHFSSTSVRKLTQTPEYIYASTQGGLFRYSLSDGNLESLSKADGFSESGIAEMAYHPRQNALIIGYTNGNIDFLRGNQITNLSAIKRSNLSVRTINQIIAYNNEAYLACEFGLVILNVARNEIRATNLNLGGTIQIPAYSLTILRDTLYVATSQGIKYAPVRANLQDPSVFLNYTTVDGVPTTKVRWLANKGGALFAAVNNNGVFKREGARWSELIDNNAVTFTTLESAGDSLLITTPRELWVCRGLTSDYRVVAYPSLTNLTDALRAPNGSLWVSDLGKGLARMGAEGPELQRISGPFSDNTFKMFMWGKRVASATGGWRAGSYEPTYRDLGFTVFDRGEWRNYASNAEIANIPVYAGDIVDGYYDANTDRLYISSYGNGVLVFDGQGNMLQQINQFQPSNTQLVDICPGCAPVRITSAKTDSRGNLWMTQHIHPTHPVHKLASDGSWRSYSFPGVMDENVEQLEITDNGDIWIRFNSNSDRAVNGPLWVLRDGNPAQNLMIRSVTGQGNLPSERVNQIRKDADGAMWVAMDKGVGVFYNPSNVLRGQAFNISLPIFAGRPLLEQEAVSCIAFDGGGRKWFGTKGNGVYLFNRDLSAAELYFSADNSPLLSNTINDIAIDPTTGEVFFSTPAGICSYRGDATAGNKECQEIKVFPNPVTPDYRGRVALSGLVAESTVKITDVSGRLVFEGASQGGTFTWNLRDYNGQEVVSGIYLAFVSGPEGQETCLNKIAVLR